MKRHSLMFVLLVTHACASDPAEPVTALKIMTTSLPAATAMVDYNQSLKATGGSGGYRWLITWGSPPSGLGLNIMTGQISGVPTGTTSSFTVGVTSGDGQSASETLTIAVTNVLIMTTVVLPDAIMTEAYNQTLEAMGGSGGYTWSVPVGALPAGLILDPAAGVISGLPTGASSTFTIRVASGDGQAAQETLKITVTASPLVFQSVSVGTDHSCGVAMTGAGYCWGNNTDGKLGDGTNSNRNIPVAVSGGIMFKSIDAGTGHTCGVTNAGVAYCWGLNADGQLGIGTAAARSTPVAVLGGLAFKSVEAGSRHSCGVTVIGTVYCWGVNNDGTLGEGTWGTPSYLPVEVSGGLTFQSVSTGQDYSCGLTTSSVAYCWGWNSYGQLGDGTGTSRNVPTAVSGGLVFQSIDAGFSHTCGVTTTGSAYCWGNNLNGQLGTGYPPDSSYVPTAVHGGLIFKDATAAGSTVTTWNGSSFAHSCGVTLTGLGYCWGYNVDSQLGDGTSMWRTVPEAVAGGLTFQSISAGVYHSCGLTTSGAGYCWGNNSQGQLGDGTYASSTLPVLLRAP